MIWDDVTSSKVLEVGLLAFGIIGIVVYAKFAEYQAKKKGKK